MANRRDLIKWSAFALGAGAGLVGPAAAAHAAGLEWEQYPVPAAPGGNRSWQLLPSHSDEFNYTGKPQSFTDRWLDQHKDGWSGPANSLYSARHSWVADGNLIIEGRRAPDGRVYCGYVTSRTPVKYPLYTEVLMQVSGLKLSSNFWLLSRDDVNEIDVIECYGNEPLHGKHMNTAYHIFQRNPFTELARSQKGYFADGSYGYNGETGQVFGDGTGQPLLRNGFHRYGMHWISATEFDFYFNGRLVRRLNRSNDLMDPRGRFFDQPMHLILNTESHQWRVDRGIEPTDAELADPSINNVYYRWVRTYRAV
ncbi:family 16 glycosylhydrolase [Streptomyces rochei]|uniref:family 16 glycosylhydrolase n=1 Tax=Streptomyces rochei TaxID=1928 RepID=UPI003530F24F